MKSSDLKKNKLPDSAGVYFFKDNSRILYIGKASSLEDRVKSYFSKDLIKTRGPRLVDMVTLSKKVDFIKSDSVLEALILESNLIKKHNPIYNSREKDSKSYNAVVITDEKIPRVLVIRERELKSRTGQAENLKIKKIFSPFPNGLQLKEALKIIRKIFPFIDTARPFDKLSQRDKKRFKLNFQIGIYPDVDADEEAIQDYLKNIRNIDLFFQGKKMQIVKSLKNDMRKMAKLKKFEDAIKLRRTIFALEHIKDVSLLKKENIATPENFRIEAFDISHMSGNYTLGVMTVIEDGLIKKSDYRKFKIRLAKAQDDYGALEEVLSRRFNHSEWGMPNLIVIDGGIQHFTLASKILKINKSKIEIVSVVKDEKHRPSKILGDAKTIKSFKEQILLANSEAHRFAISGVRHTMSRSLTKNLK